MSAQLISRFIGAVVLLVASTSLAPAALLRPQIILVSTEASPLEQLAAREVRRYVYLRAGELLAIRTATSLPARSPQAIVIATRWRNLARSLGISAELSSLSSQRYFIKTASMNTRSAVCLVGGDDVGTLYAAYRFIEQLGVRFYLHGDSIPDERMKLALAPTDEWGEPLFALRGIQPFHDFPEGPDWWNRDDYLAIISQLPKLRMNFIGLHTYPEGAPNAEPTVWIGTEEDIGVGNKVKSSYPASYQNTLRGNWGYGAKKTSPFSFGAAELFERDDFGAELMFGSMPQPTNATAQNDVFEKTAALLHDAFQHAQGLGVKTCVGTETPLKIPKLVAERLAAEGKSATNIATIQELYRGLFARAAQAYPLDYFWFWTPEGWTWEGTKDAQVTTTTNDLFAAIAAAKEVNAPFSLATCGWVLGPQQDRAMFEKVLPKEIAVSCINREVGKTPVDPAFAKVNGRGKWAIPWMEDDPALTSPQLWVGRMRRDAQDALRYGCDGLMGIHWRTRVLGPAVSALAQASWDQSAWQTTNAPEPIHIAGAVGGKFAEFPTNNIEGADKPHLYQSVRYDVAAYHLPVPEGRYAVTLKFVEPHHKTTGKRVFDVKLQGRPVLDHLDIFARVGANRALDCTFDDISVTNGCLDVEFTPVVEYPSIAAISVRGEAFRENINCGGFAFENYVADFPPNPQPKYTFPDTSDFYRDWAAHEFGDRIAVDAAKLFAKIDGNLPRPSDWIGGPGGIRPDARAWSEVQKQYTYSDDFATLGQRVKGAGNRARFDWWQHTFAYMKAMAQLNCTWALYTNAVAELKREPNPESRAVLAGEKALPLRRDIVKQLGVVYDHLLATVSNTGELGTVANWEQHSIPDLIEKPGKELATLLGSELSADYALPTTYQGPVRVIVPTLRTSIAPGESLSLKVIVLSEQTLRNAALYSRRLGRGRFIATPLEHVARGVYRVTVPAEISADDFEYYVKVTPQKGRAVVFPAAAPDLNQTVVIAPNSSVAQMR